MIAFALVTVLTIAATLITCLPIATAQKTEAVAYLAFRPNPIGVGQELLINAWVSPPPLINIPRTGYMFYFTDPDGNIDTVGPLNPTHEGATWFIYIPDQVGNWTVQFSWAGDEYFTACETEEQPLIVQQDPIPSWPPAKLPTDEPWDYPINPENREWYQISGLWGCHGYNCSGTNYNPYSQAPSSSHILWKLPSPEGLGGLVGGDFGTAGMYLYLMSAVSISSVMAGRGYYQSGPMIHCLDIRTGEELWATFGSFTGAVIESIPIGEPGLVYFYMNIPTLLSLDSRLIKYDGLTGEIILNETGIAGRHLVDSPYVYTIDDQNSRLIKWSYYGSTTDFSERVIWNVTVPQLGECHIYDDIIVSILDDPSYSVAIDATTGAELWSTLTPKLVGNLIPTTVYGKVFYPTLNRQYAAVDLRTGETEWLSEKADYPWGAFWGYGTAAAYDMVYAPGYTGLIAFDQSTGSIVWHYSAGDSGYETPYTTWSFFEAPLVADGKVYAASGEHTPTFPIYRGQKLHCINAWNGDPIWSIMGYYNIPTVVAEGTLFATNIYDCCQYAFAKGETATTVSASPEVAANGSSILIKGTIMDMSPAQPNTPAISDASMSAWMEYLHMQQPCPMNATGVPVKLEAFAADGSVTEIGTVTSDAYGSFKSAWTPPDEGLYTIMATFAGSDSYFRSYAATGLSVGPTPPAPAESEPVEIPAYPDYTPMFAGIIAAVVVIGIANIVVMLRKRQ